MWWKPLYMGGVISLITIIPQLEFPSAVAGPQGMPASMIPADPKSDEYHKFPHELASASVSLLPQWQASWVGNEHGDGLLLEGQGTGIFCWTFGGSNQP